MVRPKLDLFTGGCSFALDALSRAEVTIVAPGLADGLTHSRVTWREAARPSQEPARSCRSVLAVGFLPGRTLAFER